jgi:hypothetical protein
MKQPTLRSIVFFVSLTFGKGACYRADPVFCAPPGDPVYPEKKCKPGLYCAIPQHECMNCTAAACPASMNEDLGGVADLAGVAFDLTLPADLSSQPDLKDVCDEKIACPPGESCVPGIVKNCVRTCEGINGKNVYGVPVGAWGNEPCGNGAQGMATGRCNPRTCQLGQRIGSTGPLDLTDCAVGLIGRKWQPGDIGIEAEIDRAAFYCL